MRHMVWTFKEELTVRVGANINSITKYVRSFGFEKIDFLRHQNIIRVFVKSPSSSRPTKLINTEIGKL